MEICHARTLDQQHATGRVMPGTASRPRWGKAFKDHFFLTLDGKRSGATWVTASGAAKGATGRIPRTATPDCRFTAKGGSGRH